MKKSFFVAIIISLGGFLFGFDSGIISGVMTFASPAFNLNEIQNGWAVSAPSFTAMFAMLVAGKLSSIYGRKKILIGVAILYGVSAIFSALAHSFTLLWMSRSIGGVAFGAALVIAPAYIAEISRARNRGKMVSIQQLNIVLGFFAAFLSNYLFNKVYQTGQVDLITAENVWRWMLGVEFIPAILYFLLLFKVPQSPRWLLLKNRPEEAKAVLVAMHGKAEAEQEFTDINANLAKKGKRKKIGLKQLFQPSLRFVLLLGIVLGILQQSTGINAVYFYATSIFKQTGIGTDASFSSGILLSTITVIFTILAILLIDKIGRRPLLIWGMGGMAISLFLCTYGFSQATYSLTPELVNRMEIKEKESLLRLTNQTYDSDVSFKKNLKAAMGNQNYLLYEGEIIESAININAYVVLIGILGFIACFAFSLGPVMWVLLSELFPNQYRGFAIGFIGFINGFTSWLVQFLFPWELYNLGNALSFGIFGGIAIIGFLVFLKILPETKGKSLEEIEKELVIN